MLAFAGKAGEEGGESFESVGVKEEVRQFVESVLTRRSGAGAGGKDEQVNRAKPRDALWDVEFIQAALTSEGKSVELDKQ